MLEQLKQAISTTSQNPNYLITPVGAYQNRMMSGIYQKNPRKLILATNPIETDKGNSMYEVNQKEIDELVNNKLLAWNQTGRLWFMNIDLESFPDSFKKLFLGTLYIRSFDDRDPTIFIDVTSGSQAFQHAAPTVASFIEDVRVYYVPKSTPTLQTYSSDEQARQLLQKITEQSEGEQFSARDILYPDFVREDRGGETIEWPHPYVGYPTGDGKELFHVLADLQRVDTITRLSYEWLGSSEKGDLIKTSRHLEKLQKCGLVTIKRNPHKRRERSVQVTNFGNVYADTLAEIIIPKQLESKGKQLFFQR